MVSKKKTRKFRGTTTYNPLSNAKNNTPKVFFFILLSAQKRINTYIRINIDDFMLLRVKKTLRRFRIKTIELLYSLKNLKH